MKILSRPCVGLVLAGLITGWLKAEGVSPLPTPVAGVRSETTGTSSSANSGDRPKLTAGVEPGQAAVKAADAHSLVAAKVPADQPAARTDPSSRLGHEQLLAKARRGGIDLYFLGDSITRRWDGTDNPQFVANWNQNFFGWNAADFGWGGDTTQNVLWRLQHGELDGVNPKVIVLLIGTNNVGRVVGDAGKVADIVRGIRAVLDLCRQKAPGAKIVLTAIFPRNDNPAVLPEIQQINEQIAHFADGNTIRYLNINDGLADPSGILYEGMAVDKLHLTVKGYQVWADRLRPILTELLGPPAATDHAPPPTGDSHAKT